MTTPPQQPSEPTEVTDRPNRALPDAAPPVWARIAAVSSIIIAGVSGGLIGWAVVDLQCTGDCATTSALVGFVSALICAIGVAVVAVLTLRATSEWKAIEARDRARLKRSVK